MTLRGQSARTRGLAGLRHPGDPAVMTEDKRHCRPGGPPYRWDDWQRVGGGYRLVGLALVAAARRLDGLGAGPWPDAPWEQAPRAAAISAHPAGHRGGRPGGSLSTWPQAWPAFGRWWREGANTRPDAAEARTRLEEHMPELVPAWQRLTAMLPGDPDAGAALALWNPPPFLTGCSQAAVLPGGPGAGPQLRLGLPAVRRAWWPGRRTPAGGCSACSTACGGCWTESTTPAWRVSLTFGGRPQVGEGFGIPLVIRYVLETCQTTEEAMQALRRIPVHMSYNVTALDRDGARATAYLAPDRPAHVTGLAVATNHQEQVEWAPYVAAIRSVERRQHLEELLAGGQPRRTSWRPACARRCTPPASTRASGPCTPRSTGPPKAARATTGPT